jgi:hypothetical protein
MVQLIAKAGQGFEELRILRRFSRPDIIFHEDNHVIPLLDELAIEDMIFAVLPLLAENVVMPWFYNIGEALEAVDQTFRVSTAGYLVLLTFLTLTFSLGSRFLA